MSLFSLGVQSETVLFQNSKFHWGKKLLRIKMRTLISPLFDYIINLTNSFVLGPLHMSPVDRASSVSEISPRHSFLRKKFDVFI